MTSSKGVMEFFPLPRVSYGIRAGHALLAEAERLGARRVCLIASTTLNDKTDEIRLIEAALGDRHAGTFTGIPAHPNENAVLSISKAVRAEKPDLIVSIGGGSVNDATKAILVCVEYGIDTLDEMVLHRAKWVDGRPYGAPFDPPMIPMIAVPITLSASEYAPMGGILDEATGFKNVYGSRKLKVEAVILDPRIARHTPEWLWLSTGVKAIDHTVETLGSFRSNDFCDGLAASALRLLAEGLAGVKADPDDDDARLKCQIASWQASIPIGHTPMALSHALGYVLGGLYHVPHGYGSCVTLPGVCAWNSQVNADRQTRISDALGRPGLAPSVALRDLIAGLGMPTRLRDVGVDEADLPAIAAEGLKGNYIPANPRPIGSADDILEVLRAVY